MSVRDRVPTPLAGRRCRAVAALAVALVALPFVACEGRGDLLGVDLAVFEIGEWSGIGAQGEEFRFFLEREEDDVMLTAFIVNLPALADSAQGQPEACGTLVDAFSSFGNVGADIPIRNGGFRFRTPDDVRVDNDGLIESVITGTFDAPDSAMVEAEIEIDATRFIACRIELMASWQMEPVGS